MNVISNGAIAKCFEYNYGADTEYGGDTKWWFVNEERWTPVDLVLRNYLNDASFHFCGLSDAEGKTALFFILEHKQELIANRQVSKKGVNNFGFQLWDNWDFDSQLL